jgi:hypothetical protein
MGNNVLHRQSEITPWASMGEQERPVYKWAELHEFYVDQPSGNEGKRL